MCQTILNFLWDKAINIQPSHILFTAAVWQVIQKYLLLTLEQILSSGFVASEFILHTTPQK